MFDKDMHSKVFNDAVHGHMTFHPLLVVIIDTPQFQRLRNVKQLGCCYFVYPSACHNRFEHCLGTAFIAGELFENLKEKGTYSDEFNSGVWQKQKLCVQISGLCHDLGHGPFSHTWEKFRQRVNPDDQWTHEEESLRILDEILDEKISPTKIFDGRTLPTVKDVFQFYGVNFNDVNIIKDMIRGRKASKHYLFQIINSKGSKIDVDKWEYLVRDSMMLNIPIAFDYKRLLKYCCLLENEEGVEEICFRDKECSVLLDMFLARGRLYDKAYHHIKVVIIEEMLVDALVLANDRLKLTQTPISQLTDHIYHKILYDDFHGDENMKKAKEILKRIENRNLYKCIGRENLQDKELDLKLLKNSLKKIPDLENVIDDISLAVIAVDMTKANKKGTLRDVRLYNQTDEEPPSAWNFERSQYHDSLMPDMKNLKRYQLVVLNKKEMEIEESLKTELLSCLRRAVIDTSSQKS